MLIELVIPDSLLGIKGEFVTEKKYLVLISITSLILEGINK